MKLQADDADATDERKKNRQMDENDYDEPEDEEEKRDAIESGDSDDDFDLTKVKLEVDETFDISRLKQEVELNSRADIEQLEEIERKEDETLKIQGDEAILRSITKYSTANTNIEVKDFTYDKEKYRWCCIKFEAPMKFKSVDMTNVLREAASASIIWQIPKIKRAFTFKQNNILMLKTDGINIGVSLILNAYINNNVFYEFSGNV